MRRPACCGRPNGDPGISAPPAQAPMRPDSTIQNAAAVTLRRSVIGWLVQTVTKAAGDYNTAQTNLPGQFEHIALAEPMPPTQSAILADSTGASMHIDIERVTVCERCFRQACMVFLPCGNLCRLPGAQRSSPASRVPRERRTPGTKEVHLSCGVSFDAYSFCCAIVRGVMSYPALLIFSPLFSSAVAQTYLFSQQLAAGYSPAPQDEHKNMQQQTPTRLGIEKERILTQQQGGTLAAGSCMRLHGSLCQHAGAVSGGRLLHLWTAATPAGHHWSLSIPCLVPPLWLRPASHIHG